MVERKRHSKKEVEQALRDAESQAWTVEPKGKSGHLWGYARCPLGKPDGCRVSIWSTPKNAGNHARDIRRALRNCGHSHEDDDDGNT